MLSATSVCAAGVDVFPPLSVRTKTPGAWRVYVNGRDTGIVESSLPFAFAYYTQRHRETGHKYRLEEIDMSYRKRA